MVPVAGRFFHPSCVLCLLRWWATLAGMNDVSDRLAPLAVRLGELLSRRGLTIAVAESCTGGWIAKTLTDVPGSSGWVDRGFVTYSNAAKREMLGVGSAVLETQGAVSEATVLEMVAGVLARSRAQVATAVSGVAGPGGGSTDKPVGTVWIAWAVPGRPHWAERHWFAGDRERVRRQTVRLALEGLISALDEPDAEPDG
jgi:nicotinamide-nucleotide amidase